MLRIRHTARGLAFDERPTPQQREAFAHRYADEFRAQMTDWHLLPFAAIYDILKLRAERLDPQWFARIGAG